MKTSATTLVKKAVLFISEYILLIASLFLLTFSSCDQSDLKDDDHQGHSHDAARKTTTHYGPAVPVGGGVARTYVITGKDGKPAEIGVSLSRKALTGLPDHTHDDHGPEFILEFPKQTALTPFRFVTLGWNPHGHEPKPIYAKPHFDFHFYMISDQERKPITGLPPTQMDPELPALQFLPTDYIPTPGRIPAMGTHWVDRTSPELNGEEFTQTFIYGSYQHKIIFYEPMITREYLLSMPKTTMPVKQPAAFGKAGYYPASYRIEYDEKAKEYRVALTDLREREVQ